MFEGEKFFAAFERGIEVDAGRPPCPERAWVYHFCYAC